MTDAVYRIPVVKLAAPGLFVSGELLAAFGEAAIVEPFDPGQPLCRQVARANVLVTRDIAIDANVMAAAPGLKLIQRAGKHIENVDFDCARRRGVPVCNIDGLDGSAVAEHAMYLILTVAKRLRRSDAKVAAGIAGQPTTVALRGKTLGLVGIGTTGLPLLRMAKAFGMRTAAVKRIAGSAVQAELGLDWLGTLDDLGALLEQSDVISLHLPLQEATRKIIAEREFGRMKPGAILVNVARAGLVDKDSLLAALSNGCLEGAGLDVAWQEPVDPRDPLLALPNVVMTPHIAGFTDDDQAFLARAVADNTLRVMRGEVPHNQLC